MRTEQLLSSSSAAAAAASSAITVTQILQRVTVGAVRGMALLGNHLYVLHIRSCDQLDELDAHNLQLHRRLSVPEDDSPRHFADMASCQRRRRLYISHSTSDCVHVLLLASGEVWSKWTTDGSPWGLSVTPDTGNLLVTIRYDGRVDEYSPGGQRLRRVDLLRGGVFCPWHVIQRSSLPSEPEMLLVGHGDHADDAVRVGFVRVLDDGSTVGQRWYGGRPGDSAHSLSRPQHLAIGRNGTIAVADARCGVVLLDDELHHVGVVEAAAADRRAGWRKSRVCWIGRGLCVAESQLIGGKGKFADAAKLTLYELH